MKLKQLLSEGYWDNEEPDYDQGPENEFEEMNLPWELYDEDNNMTQAQLKLNVEFEIDYGRMPTRRELARAAAEDIDIDQDKKMEPVGIEILSVTVDGQEMSAQEAIQKYTEDNFEQSDILAHVKYELAKPKRRRYENVKFNKLPVTRFASQQDPVKDASDAPKADVIPFGRKPAV